MNTFLSLWHNFDFFPHHKSSTHTFYFTLKKKLCELFCLTSPSPSIRFSLELRLLPLCEIKSLFRKFKQKTSIFSPKNKNRWVKFGIGHNSPKLSQKSIIIIVQNPLDDDLVSNFRIVRWETMQLPLSSLRTQEHTSQYIDSEYVVVRFFFITSDAMIS